MDHPFTSQARDSVDFVARGVELAALRRCVVEEGCRLVALVEGNSVTSPGASWLRTWRQISTASTSATCAVRGSRPCCTCCVRAVVC
jgi:hypothetical protein